MRGILVMSRIGNNPISIPDGVKVDLNDNVISISGQKGSQSWSFHPNIKVSVEGNNIIFKRMDENC